MKSRQIVIVVVTYAVAHLSSAWAGHRANALVHDLAFSYAAILAGLLIGAVGVFLTVLTTLTTAIREFGADEALEGVTSSISKVTVELREDVLLALMLVAIQGVVEVARVVDVPAVIWPISVASLSKGTVLNAIGLTAAALELACVLDCVRAMFTAHDLSELLASRKGSTTKPRAR